MRDSKIFFLGQDAGSLTTLTEAPYDTEEVLQLLLANFPDLLPGEQIDPENPCRWLLVSREMGVPGEEDGADRWAVDHLFLDQAAIPTLIEVKRSGDTRIRREVVGQMLDYAANAVAYWPVEAVRARFEEGCRNRGTDPAKEVETLVGPQARGDDFWQRVKTNLQAGRVRMVFVADVIPSELRRIVEFLNGQMDPAEVLAVEIKQFVGQGLKTLVPRVIGQTAEAERKKSGVGPAKQPMIRSEFLGKCQAATVPFFTRFLDEAERKGQLVDWGHSAFSVRARLTKDRSVQCVIGYPNGQFDFYLANLPQASASKLRAKILACPVFKEVGKHTLRAQVDGQADDALLGISNAILAEIEATALTQSRPVERQTN